MHRTQRQITMVAVSIAIAASLFGLTIPARAQDEPEPDAEIEELEVTYQKELAGIHRELGEKWLEALSNLKDSLTREQKFAEALLVRNELQRVTKLLETNQLPSTSRGPSEEITLLPRDATLAGDLQLSKKSEISRWSGVGASVTWKIPADLTPGAYEIILNYKCGQNGGGSFKVKVGSGQELAGSVSADDSDSDWRELRSTLVGECTIDRRTGRIQIISTVHTDRDLMNISSIRLAPKGTWTKAK